jgi:hypothetical protein
LLLILLGTILSILFVSGIKKRAFSKKARFCFYNQSNGLLYLSTQYIVLDAALDDVDLSVDE